MCADCRDAPPRYKQLRSWSIFDGPVRPALHRLKYRHDIGLGEALIPQLSHFAAALRWPADLLVPVPLGSHRLKERGYNQASLIGWPLSLALELSFAPRAIRRTRETRSQVGLSRGARQDNVRDAFQAKPELTNGRTVLLVDDIATTGATLSSCAEALYAAGARDVFALTVSRAQRYSSPESEPGGAPGGNTVGIEEAV
jgi:ComF family protein